MPLIAGQRIGQYEIIGRIGAGAMGEVWQARDPAIGRTVAIKIIAPALARDAERLRRFEYEARAAGQINHPNILTIHAVGREGDVAYLVSELLHGQTLGAKLRGGALPPALAVDYAIQIANGLAAAHDRHIVHRDLKPDNLFVTEEERVKILDFGLAKLTEPSPGGDSQTRTATELGAVVGTAGYMSPEQVRGQPLDARSDIFAFGAVFYEMLTGRRAFAGSTAAETMSAILERQPAPLEGVAPALAKVVQRAFEKKPSARFQSAQDLAFHLETLREPATAPLELAGVSAARATPRRNRAWLWAGLWAILWTVIVSGLGWWIAALDRPTATAASSPSTLRRFAIPLTTAPLPRLEWPPLALSRDGRRLAYVVGRMGASRILLRNLDELTERPIPGTENGHTPFFAPDGQHIGFFVGGTLHRIALEGGPPARIADTAPVSRGATWSTDGWIYVAPSQSSGIVRVRADGGSQKPEAVTSVSGAGDIWPDVAPDGQRLVYVERNGDSFDEARVVLRSLATGEQKVLVEGATFARFAGNDRLIYARRDTLFAVALDGRSLGLAGDAQPFLTGVQMDPLFGFASYAVALDGTLAYVAGDARPVGRTLFWVTPSGGETRAFPDEHPFLMPAVSPDGTSIAVTIEGMHQDLWRIDLGRPVLVRLTTHPGEDFGPVWSPDGRELLFTSVRAGHPPAVFVKPARTADAEAPVTTAEGTFPNAWTHDGKTALVTSGSRLDGRTGMQLVQVRNPQKPQALASSRFDRFAAALAPDDSHVAFVSMETGRAEVYVASWPGVTDVRQASVGGGSSPVWARTGRTLFYRSGDGLFGVDVDSAGHPARPRLMFRGRFEERGRPDWPRNYDVAPDGRFLMIRQTYEPIGREVVVLLNWNGQIVAPAAR